MKPSDSRGMEHGCRGRGTDRRPTFNLGIKVFKLNRKYDKAATFIKDIYLSQIFHVLHCRLAQYDM
jgi:hypothetical protein